MSVADKLKNAKPQVPPQVTGEIDPESQRYSDDTKHRKKLVYWVMFVVSLWLLLGIFGFLVLYGFGCIFVEPIIIEALLVTTTANILGLPYIVLKGLFDVDRHNS